MTARFRRREALRRRSESGFTLIELLITMVILPLIDGALALAIVAVFSLNGTTGSRVGDAADAQILSTTYENDVHSASEVTAEPTIQCGTTGEAGTQLLAVEYGSNTGTYQTVISYVRVATGSTSTDEILRQVCTNGNLTAPSSTSVASADISPSNGAAVITPVSPPTSACPSTLAPTTSWVEASCVTGVSFAANEPASSLSYSLVATPVASLSSGQAGTLSATSDCGFATAGTGTYAKTLCFLDFSTLSPTEDSSTTPSGPTADPTYCGSGGQYMSAGIDNSPYTIEFCLLVTSLNPTATSYSGLATGACPTEPGASPYGAVCPAYIPTYYNPSGGSEAFLGNNGFYTNIAGNPAVYTTQSDTTVELQYYNIQVVGASGTPATGWELATGDAESTDTAEWLAWSTCPSFAPISNLTATPPTPPTSTGCGNSTTSPPLMLLPNEPGNTEVADIGNACTYTTSVISNSMFPGKTYLTGVGTNTVECEADNSTNKTGTVMLQASAPSSLTVEMHGEGLQAIFVGLVLQ
jgi:prepilin-type N-terminal cleavage/methylation domain-containing protein